MNSVRTKLRFFILAATGLREKNDAVQKHLLSEGTPLLLSVLKISANFAAPNTESANRSWKTSMGDFL